MQGKPMRLDRFLTGQTAFSRKAAAESIRAGAVTVNGTVCRKADAQILPESDRICVRGQAVSYAKYRTLMLHKPVGVITAARDPQHRTVLDLIRTEDRTPDLMPCGRLDLDTSGLLLLTDDGQLAHRLISPKTHLTKYYLARLRDPFDRANIALFAAGITLREGGGQVQCLPAECVQVDAHTALLGICEGKYHQVRRMFAAAGNAVTDLLRVQVGGLSLPPDLPPGGYMPILDKEQNDLWSKTDISAVFDLCCCDYSSYWIESGK